MVPCSSLVGKEAWEEWGNKVVNAFAEHTRCQNKCKTLQPAVNKLETLPLASQGCTNALGLKAGRAIQTPGKRYLTSTLGYGQAASDMAASMSRSLFSTSIFLDDPNRAYKDSELPAEPSARAQGSRKMVSWYREMTTTIIPWLLTPNPGNDRAAGLSSWGFWTLLWCMRQRKEEGESVLLAPKKKACKSQLWSRSPVTCALFFQPPPLWNGPSNLDALPNFSWQSQGWRRRLPLVYL